MPFTYRDKPKLSDRLRGKSGEEILNEMKGDLDSGRRMFFDSPWRAGHNNSGFPRGFPFDDYPSRPNARSYWANRHPEFAEDLKEPWAEDFKNQFFPERASNSGGRKTSAPKEAECGSASCEARQSPKLNQFGLRNTVPLGQNANPEEQRRQRSMSAPPDSRATDKPKRFISKCEIPMMQDPEEQGIPPAHEPRPGNSTNVRIIPIQVEGRDQPVINADIDSPGNFGAEKVPFEARLPRDFGSYQRHSPRFAHKERGPPPPQQHHPQQHQYQHPHPHQYQQPHQQPHPQYQQPHQQPHPQYQQPHQQPHPQYQQPRQQPQPQPKAQAPPEPMPMPMPMPPPPQQQQQQQQPPPQPPPQPDEVDSKRPETPKPPEPPKDPLTKVGLIQKEVDELKQQVEAFNGKSRSDKQYMMLDEMLTRKLISLDDINTEGKEDVRQARKDTIRSIQRCISMLESRVPPVENKDGNDAKAEESTALVPVGPMEVDTIKENSVEPGSEAGSRENGQAPGEVVQG